MQDDLIVREWQKASGLDTARTPLIGFSQGAIMALESTQTDGPPAGRVIALSGLADLKGSSLRNPHVLALRDEFWIPPDGERLTVSLGDGAAFVREARKACDVLMVDAAPFSPAGGR